MTSTRRIGLLAALAVAALGASAPAASAGEDESINASGGRVNFFDHDEVIQAFDGRRDGLGVSAYLLKSEAVPPEPSSATASVLRGDLNHVTDDTGFDSFDRKKDLSIREGATVWLQMCYADELDAVVKCSRWQRAEA